MLFGQAKHPAFKIFGHTYLKFGKVVVEQDADILGKIYPNTPQRIKLNNEVGMDWVRRNFESFPDVVKPRQGQGSRIYIALFNSDLGSIPSSSADFSSIQFNFGSEEGAPSSFSAATAAGSSEGAVASTSKGTATPSDFSGYLEASIASRVLISGSLANN